MHRSSGFADWIERIQGFRDSGIHWIRDPGLGMRDSGFSLGPRVGFRAAIAISHVKRIRSHQMGDSMPKLTRAVAAAATLAVVIVAGEFLRPVTVIGDVIKD